MDVYEQLVVEAAALDVSVEAYIEALIAAAKGHWPLGTFPIVSYKPSMDA